MMNRMVLSSLAICALAGVAQADIFTNPAPIAINDAAPATPYPSTITVPGTFVGGIASISVTLTGLSHTFDADIDILLVGPGGQSVILMADAGNGSGLTGVNLTFADGNPSLPAGSSFGSGTYAPTDVFGGNLFPAPAPIGPYGANFASFLGTSAVGVWSLYVVDDAGIDVGSIAGGWSMNITVPTPGAAAMLGLGGLLVSRRRR